MEDNLRRPPPRATRKRKSAPYMDEDDDAALVEYPYAPKKSRGASQVMHLTQYSPKKTLATKRGKRDADAPAEEKRARPFRKKAPQSYLAVKERALTQRLTVLSRARSGNDDAPGETVIVAGSTGNVYTISIGLVPSCDCPHANKGNQCKHIVYVMLRVLKAREDIAYQLALVRSELREVMTNAPPIPGVETDGRHGTKTQGEHGNRKPIQGECPICYDELGAGGAIVYCKASCGNNVHKSCMQNWMAASIGKATCPYCRANWAADTGFDVKLGGVLIQGLERNEHGYVNVAGRLGLSGERDYSTYHPYWARRHRGSSGQRRGRYGYYDHGY